MPMWLGPKIWAQNCKNCDKNLDFTVTSSTMPT